MDAGLLYFIDMWTGVALPPEGGGIDIKPPPPPVIGGSSIGLNKVNRVIL
jgi:hypothetical protein